jgi:hypothetical protein
MSGAGRVGVALGLGLGLSLGLAITACVTPRPEPPAWQGAHERRGEIIALATQIRDWRREAGMGVEPPPTLVVQMRTTSARGARQPATCNGAAPPPPCHDVCSIADAICDNADRICRIAGELPGDAWAADKCDSAKASCREARERCCGCQREAEP